MAFTVSMREIYQAAPTLTRLAQVKLSPIGAMRISQVMLAVDMAINAFETDRQAKLKELAVLKEDGTISYHTEADEQGKERQKADFPTPEAEKAMENYGNELLGRGVRIPFRIKTKHLTQIAGMANSGYALSVQDCRNLGRFLSYDDLPAELDESLEEGEK
jgi:hypothetical protein